MKYTLLRNATAVLEYAGSRLLIDPALDPAGARPAIPNTANQRPNPLVELPAGWESMVAGIDAVLITHMHQDHFDGTAAEVLEPGLQVFSQPEDADRLRGLGFGNVLPVGDSVTWEGINLTRTPAQHGAGDIAVAMAPVSGFILRAPDEPTLYIVGDSIWYGDIAATIASEQPDAIVINASGASFLEGGAIVMDAEDIAAVRQAAPAATIVIVHLEAINHCHQSRAYYRQRLPELGLDLTSILIPDDGETVSVLAGA